MKRKIGVIDACKKRRKLKKTITKLRHARKRKRKKNEIEACKKIQEKKPKSTHVSKGKEKN